MTTPKCGRVSLRVKSQTSEIRTRASGAQSMRVGATGSLRGPQGPPGISPDVTVTPISGGHRVTIWDADGANTFDVMDGSANMEGLTNAELEEMLK